MTTDPTDLCVLWLFSYVFNDLSLLSNDFVWFLTAVYLPLCRGLTSQVVMIRPVWFCCVFGVLVVLAVCCSFCVQFLFYLEVSFSLCFVLLVLPVFSRLG